MEKKEQERNVEDRDHVTYREGLCRKDLKHVQQYVESTTTHGVVRVFGGDATYVKRFVWLLIFLASFSGLLVIFVNRAERLRSTPKSTTLEYNQVSSLDFPAVTICNQNTLKGTFLEREGLVDFFECLFNVSSTSDCTSLLPSDAAAQWPLVDVLIEGGQSEEEFLQFCFFHNDTCEGRGINVQRTFVNSEVCYTLNSDMTKTLSVTNPQQALYLELNLNNSAFSGIATEYGASIIIHPPDVPPRLELAVRVPAGFKTFITLSVQTQRLLRPAYGKCTPFQDLEYYPGVYNIPACIRNQEFKQVADGCGCLHPEAPQDQNPNNLTKCSLSQLGCVTIYSDTSAVSINTICPVACQSVLYQPTVSYTTLQNFITLSPGDSLTAASFGNSEVQIQFPSLQTLQVTETEAYGVGDFFSDIGGNMGLFLGASIISLFEFIMLISDELMDRVLQVWRLRKLIVSKWKKNSTSNSQSNKLKGDPEGNDFQAFEATSTY